MLCRLSRTICSALALAAMACSGAAVVGSSENDVQSDGSCSQPSMFIMGSPRNYAKGLQMTCSNGEWTTDELFAGTGNVFAAGAFKFTVREGDFSVNFGDNLPRDGIADQGGNENDIVVNDPGTYTIHFNDRSLRYRLDKKAVSCSRPTMFIRGSLNGGNPQSMFCVDNRKWAAIAMFIGANEQFRFDSLADGSVTFGDADSGADDGTSKDPRTNERLFTGTATQTGAQDQGINAPGSGRFLVVFDEDTLQYTLRFISPACSTPQMTLRAANNNFQPVAMECENGHWAINWSANGGTDFKFDEFGDFKTNWGDNGQGSVGTLSDGTPLFQGVPNGGNIHLVGTHHIHFYNDKRYAFDTHI
jgi:hypothetical protein